MTPDRTRGLVAAVAVALAGSLALLGACTDGQDGPAGPEQAPDFYHSGDLSDGEADATKTISDNIAGDGSEVCNDSRVQDVDFVGDDEGTWFGQKVDPPEDVTNNSFTFDVSSDEKSLAWTDDGKNLMQAVLIKAGGSSVVYYYNEGDPGSTPDPVEDFRDSGLDGDDDKEISHYVYCFVEQPAVKSGLKLNDLDASGDSSKGDAALAGWTVSVYEDKDADGVLDGGEPLVADTPTADGKGKLDKGEYEFVLQPGDYVVCEEERDGWNQSFPTGKGDCSAGSGLADEGYGVSLAPAEMDTTNHFGNNQTTIEVTVVQDQDEDGQKEPVADRRVVAVHSENGPYQDGVLNAAKTNTDGLAVIDNLDPTGEYCVRSTPLVAPSERVIPPADSGDAPDFSDSFGTAVSTSAGSKPLTLSNYESACLSDPPLSPGDEITLKLQGDAGNVEGAFETLDGENVEVSAWLVADVGSLGVPSSWIGNLPDDLETRVRNGTGKVGLFVSADEDQGTPAFEVPTPGGNAALESDKVPAGDGFQTASASVSGAVDTDTVPTEPLFCRTNTVEEGAEDGGKVELIGPYKHGFLADADLKVLGDKFGISYAQTPGEAKLKLRAKAKNTKRLVVDYECFEDGTCDIQKTKGGLANKLDSVKLGDAGGNRVRWVISGLPAGTDTVQSGVSAPNDQIPDAAKDQDDDGLVDANLPDNCVTEGSTWILGAD